MDLRRKLSGRANRDGVEGSRFSSVIFFAIRAAAGLVGQALPVFVFAASHRPLIGCNDCFTYRRIKRDLELKQNVMAPCMDSSLPPGG
jgi:hypothetical protein